MPSEPSGAIPLTASTEKTRTSLTHPVHHGAGAGVIQALNGMARIPGLLASGRDQLKGSWSQRDSLYAETEPIRACAVRAGWARSLTSKTDSAIERWFQPGWPLESSGGSTPVAG